MVRRIDITCDRIRDLGDPRVAEAVEALSRVDPKDYVPLVLVRTASGKLLNGEGDTVVPLLLLSARPNRPVSPGLADTMEPRLAGGQMAEDRGCAVLGQTAIPAQSYPMVFGPVLVRTPEGDDSDIAVGKWSSDPTFRCGFEMGRRGVGLPLTGWGLGSAFRCDVSGWCWTEMVQESGYRQPG
jgi:hypothetical protein